MGPDGVCLGEFCRAWTDSVEGYNGLVAGMSMLKKIMAGKGQF